jgi:ribosome-interacting GTPase 1
MGVPEKIRAIEKEIKRTQINKHTEHHVGLLKAKLAKLRAEQEHSQGSRQGGAAFELRKGGDCTAVLIGLPSVGKSTILNRLTNAKSQQSTSCQERPVQSSHKGPSRNQSTSV